MGRSLDNLPQYLRKYCIEHDYKKYTDRDHAAWRYIMRRSLSFFRKHAVSVYEPGLKKTGIPLNYIPHIDDMDRALQNFGWGAVPVCGFIPPWAFLEFQARKILPIATDMRNADNISYTPAPDIVHEAAGHAPIIPDIEYSNYLATYAKIGTKAIYSSQDLRLYEAVRTLSDLKEKYGTTEEEIAAAEKNLIEVNNSFTFTSEAAKVGRMSWWTAEYGLVGSLTAPKIYGAGLLSSVGESRHLYEESVKKIPFSLDCTNYQFNITEPQPQLFVAEDMQHLITVLKELEMTLSYKRGGVYALEKALESEAITTTVLDSGVAISGKLIKYLIENDRVDFIKYEGPVQITDGNKEYEGQGVPRHPTGFSSPIGYWSHNPNKNPSEFTDADLAAINIYKGKIIEINFTSGFKVKGKLVGTIRDKQKLKIMTFVDCTVSRQDEIFFEPSWGEFDMVVGTSIPSIFGGPADRINFGEHEIAESQTSPSRETPYSDKELQVIRLHTTLRKIREELSKNIKKTSEASQELAQISQELIKNHKKQWLLQLEALEIAKEQLMLNEETAWVAQLAKELKPDNNKLSDDDVELRNTGLSIIGTL
ncbi:MAG: phenylalanine 4-monooxygenase [Zetaproteobacteria bacterium]|nr:phenylalanine 4-monooxygenase [Pseudobdellovibrionaceae bacterium]